MLHKRKYYHYDETYCGITHYIPTWLLFIWLHIFCKHGWHLWDEVVSYEGDYQEHYLVCDACDSTITIDNVDLVCSWERRKPNVGKN